MKRLSLADLQHWMQTVVTHPGGVVEGAAADEAQARIATGGDDLSPIILPGQTLSSAERLAVYSNAYFGRLLECMRELFPALRHAVDDVFDQFAIGYITTLPPESYTLDQLSDRFVPFLRETRDKIASAEETWPDFVVDLAALEWNIDKVFDGPGTEKLNPLSSADLASIDPQAFAEARLELAPCIRLLSFRFPVNDYYSAWRGIDEAGEQRLPLPEAEPTWLALHRRNYVVRRFPLNPAQFRLLTALERGGTVAAAIASAAEGAEESFESNLGHSFQEWTAAGFFLALK